MPIRIFAFPNYYAKVLAVGKDKVFLLVSNLRFLLYNTCENKTDSDEKRIFSLKLSEAHIYLYLFSHIYILILFLLILYIYTYFQFYFYFHIYIYLFSMD